MASSLSPSKEIRTHFDMDEHLWVEILKRLPVIVLGRIRCVCKSLNSLISSSFFVSNHLSINVTSSSSNYSDKQTYIFFTFPTNTKRAYTYAYYNPQEPHLAEHPKFWPLPFHNQDALHADTVDTFHIIGVIHGVVCLSREAHSPDATNSAILWNPTIRKYLTTGPLSRVGSSAVGFGFDGRTNDFKVVAFLPDSSSFEVFSTGVGRWRSVACDDNIIGPFSLITQFNCFKNGSIHWIMRRPDDVKALLVFDCEKEEFKFMALPQGLSKEGRAESPRIFITCCTGMLSLMLLSFSREKGMEMDVWVMQEYGVLNSWKKLTRDEEMDFVNIKQNGELFQLQVGTRDRMWKRVDHGLCKRSQQIWNGYIFEPSLFLMDGAMWGDNIWVEDV